MERAHTIDYRVQFEEIKKKKTGCAKRVTLFVSNTKMRFHILQANQTQENNGRQNQKGNT